MDSNGSKIPTWIFRGVAAVLLGVLSFLAIEQRQETKLNSRSNMDLQIALARVEGEMQLARELLRRVEQELKELKEGQ